mmetsp:Transcript_58991/g.169375  ORF Transcript_58991/g.169375 Transcript_58991/m.169375 type:complete len:100 (-) Transcript_58991:276-575(-)
MGSVTHWLMFDQKTWQQASLVHSAQQMFVDQLGLRLQQMLFVQLGLQFMGLLRENKQQLWMNKIGSLRRLAKHASTPAQFTMAMRLSENSHATCWIFFE